MVIESAFFWMGAKKEVKLNYERDRHTKIIVKAIEYLKKSVELYVAGDLESKKYATKVMKCEQCGDVIFRDLIMKIANSLIPANEKHDLMSLLTHMEHVAEYASRAARTLLIGHSVELPEELRQLLLELTLRVYDCIVSLDRLSEERRDFQRIMEISEEVIEKKKPITETFELETGLEKILEEDVIYPGVTVDLNGIQKVSKELSKRIR